MESRHAKCFDVFCECANENIFQKGDILLVRKDKKITQDNRCAQSKEKISNTNAHLNFLSRSGLSRIRYFIKSFYYVFRCRRRHAERQHARIVTLVSD